MNKKLSFTQKNDFIKRYQTGDEALFEKDKEYFFKLFPTSPMIQQIAKANQFNRLSLNGRMLMDMLDVVCPEAILDYRGIKRKNKPAGETEEEKAERLAREEAEKQNALNKELLEADIEQMKYNDAVSLFSRMKLEAESRSSEHVKAALIDKQAKLIEAEGKNVSNTDGNPDSTTEIPEGNKSGNNEKKSEDQEQNTPESPGTK